MPNQSLPIALKNHYLDQRLRLRYAKRGRLRFSSHRDFQRAFERALRRAGVPMAYSQGFNPHPRVSYANSAPTGTASEAEYVEIAVTAAEGELTARGDTDLSDEMVRVEQLRERARGIAAVLVERRRSMERDRGQLMDSGVIANLEGEAERLRAEIAEVEADLERMGPEAESLAAEEAAFADTDHLAPTSRKGCGRFALSCPRICLNCRRATRIPF